MNKTQNNKKIFNTIYGLGMLAIFTLGIMTTIPAEASARYRYEPVYGSTYALWCEDCYERDNDYQYTYYQTPTYYYNPTPVYYNPAPIAYVNPAPVAPQPTPTVYSSTVNPTVKTSTSKTVAKAKTTTATNTPSTVAKTTTKTPESALVASAIFGTNSFLPSGLVQWIFFAILVLIATILVRKIYGGNEKYNAVPLKHD
jgi:hypothetical protein